MSGNQALQVPQGFPSALFIPVQLLGKGIHGQVYFSYSKNDKECVAVKYLNKYQNSYQDSNCLETEVTALRKIKNAPPTPFQQNFPVILGFSDLSSPNQGWLALQAYNPSLTLQPFFQYEPLVVPRELTAQFFLQIGGALRFLHEDLRIMHNDLSPQNIIINSSFISQDKNGLPTFVLIDFSRSEGLTEALQHEDSRSLCHYTKRLFAMDFTNPVSISENEWEELQALLGGPEGFSYSDEDTRKEALMRISGLAEKIVHGLTAETRDKVKNLIKELIERDGQFIPDSDVKQAVQRESEHE